MPVSVAPHMPNRVWRFALPPVLASHYTDAEMKESEGLYRSFRFLKESALRPCCRPRRTRPVSDTFFFMRPRRRTKGVRAADRELQGDMLQYGEKVQRKAKVFMRRPSDYYRAPTEFSTRRTIA